MRNCVRNVKKKTKDDTNLIPTANTSTIGKTSTFSPELKRSLKTSRPESPDVTRAAKRLERSRQQKNSGDSRLDTTTAGANGGLKVHINESDDLKSEYIEINSDNNKSAGGNDTAAAKVFMCDVHKRKQNGSTGTRSTKMSCNNTTNVVANIIENPAVVTLPQPPLSQSSSASSSPPILPQGEGGGADPPSLEKSEMLGAISKTSKRLVFDHFTKR